MLSRPTFPFTFSRGCRIPFVHSSGTSWISQILFKSILNSSIPSSPNHFSNSRVMPVCPPLFPLAVFFIYFSSSSCEKGLVPSSLYAFSHKCGFWYAYPFCICVGMSATDCTCVCSLSLGSFPLESNSVWKNTLTSSFTPSSSFTCTSLPSLITHTDFSLLLSLCSFIMDLITFPFSFGFFSFASLSCARCSISSCLSLSISLLSRFRCSLYWSSQLVNIFFWLWL